MQKGRKLHEILEDCENYDPPAFSQPKRLSEIDDCETDPDNLTAVHPEGSDRNNQSA